MLEPPKTYDKLDQEIRNQILIDESNKKERELLKQWLCTITEKFKKVFDDFFKNNDKNHEL